MPGAYWLSAHTAFFADWLDRHGIAYERLRTPREVDAAWEAYGALDATGRFPCVARHRGRRTLPAGSLHVPLAGAQRRLAALLLEPRSPSSLFSHAAHAPLVRAGAPFFLLRAAGSERSA